MIFSRILKTLLEYFSQINYRTCAWTSDLQHSWDLTFCLKWLKETDTWLQTCSNILEVWLRLAQKSQSLEFIIGLVTWVALKYLKLGFDLSGMAYWTWELLQKYLRVTWTCLKLLNGHETWLDTCSKILEAWHLTWICLKLLLRTWLAAEIHEFWLSLVLNGLKDLGIDLELSLLIKIGFEICSRILESWLGFDSNCLKDYRLDSRLAPKYLRLDFE